MPHIRVRGITLEQTLAFSEGLNEQLAKIIQTSADNFTIEHIASQFVEQGTLGTAYPFVEILWFARSQEIKNQCAIYVTDKMKKIIDPLDVAVVFTPIEKNDYFENGNHF